MNNFEPKYIKISMHYLEEKMQLLKVQRKNDKESKAKSESAIHKLMSGFFK